MAKIDVGHSELKEAFKTHAKLNGGSCSHYLILFYAAECGLKCLLTSSLYQKRPKSVNELRVNIETHNLEELFNELKIPAHKKYKPCHPVRNRNETFSNEQLHQAWRYGVIINPEEEIQAVEWLTGIVEIVKQKLII